MKPIGVVAVIVIAGIVGGAVGYGVYKVSVKQQAAVTPAAPVPAATAAPTPAPAAVKEEKFLEEARKLAETTPPAKEEPGTLPPANGDQSEVPVIATDPEGTLDLGTISTDGPATGELKVLNKGKVNLVITEVKTSCGCTKAKIDDDKKTIPPGGSSLVTITVNPKLIAGAVSHKTVTIISNDPVHNRLTIDVVAKINPEFVLEPAAIDFGDIAKGAMAEQNVILRQAGEEPIEILELRPSLQMSGLEASFKKRPENEWAAPNRPEYIVTVTLTQEAPAGLFNSSITVKTTCKRMATTPLPVKANIKTFYELSPPPMRPLMINATPQLGQDSSPAPAKITVKADRPFEVVNIQTSTPSLTATSGPGEAANSVVIQVAVPPDTKPGRLAETVSFDIKAGDQTFREKYNVRIAASQQPPKTVLPGAAGTPQLPPPREMPVNPQPPKTALPGAVGPSTVPGAPREMPMNPQPTGGK